MISNINRKSDCGLQSACADELTNLKPFEKRFDIAFLKVTMVVKKYYSKRNLFEGLTKKSYA